MRPPYITSSVSDSPISSSRSADTSSDGQPVAPGLLHDVPDRRLRADVDAAGRVGGDQHRGLRHHLPADDELLLVAARERVGGDVGAGRAHVEAVDDLLGPSPGALAVDPEPASHRTAGSGGRARRSPTAAPSARARRAGDPPGCSRGRRRAGPWCRRGWRRARRSRCVPAASGCGAEQRLDQLGLAVALDAGDADDLAPMDGERDVVDERDDRRRRPATVRPSTRERRPDR